MVLIGEEGFEPWMSRIYQEVSISWAIGLVAKQFILFDLFLACETNPFFVANSFRIACQKNMRWNCIISYNNLN